MTPAAGEPAGPHPPSRSDTDTSVDLVCRLKPGALVAGRYRIDSQVGRGGMGVVYKARDQELDQDVALKVLRPDMGTDPDWVARFRRELVLAREITHKNVVRIHDIGESDGLRFLTMRLVEGRSLLDLLQDGPLEVERALRIFRQVAEALQQAHEAGIVHRDLKPANILLSHDETAFITDFGVARSLSGDRVTRAGEIVGTLAYLAPEQIAGGETDARSDIYALGLLLFEMLTGELPFASASRAENGHFSGHARDVARHGRARAGSRPPPGAALPGPIPQPALSGRARAARRPGLSTRRASGTACLVGRDSSSSRPSPCPRGERRTGTGPEDRMLRPPLVPRSGTSRSPCCPWGTRPRSRLSRGRRWASPRCSPRSSRRRPRLRVVSPARVLRTLRDLKLADAPLEEASLRRVAQMLDVTHLVSGRLRRAGDTLRLDLQLVDGERRGHGRGPEPGRRNPGGERPLPRDRRRRAASPPRAGRARRRRRAHAGARHLLAGGGERLSRRAGADARRQLRAGRPRFRAGGGGRSALRLRPGRAGRGLPGPRVSRQGRFRHRERGRRPGAAPDTPGLARARPARHAPRRSRRGGVGLRRAGPPVSERHRSPLRSRRRAVGTGGGGESGGDARAPHRARQDRRAGLLPARPEHDPGGRRAPGDRRPPPARPRPS